MLGHSCSATPRWGVLGCPPAAAELAALTHGPGHRQTADVQRLIGLHRLPHCFQDIHCRDRRGGGGPRVVPPSPRAPGTCWAGQGALAAEPESRLWAGGAARTVGTVPCSGRSVSEMGSSVALQGSLLLTMARSATICKKWGAQCLHSPSRPLGRAHTCWGPCIPPWSTSHAGP